MLWGMAKATNPSDDVTGHRPLQMISQIFVVNIFNMNSLFITALFHQLVEHLFLKHHATLHRSNHPESPSILVLMLVADPAVLREKASLARADLLPDAR